VVNASRARRGLVPIRGDVWLAALDPTIGSEIQKTRPCLVVSPPEMNQRLRTIMAAPMTTGSRPAPSRIPVIFQGRAGFILLDQLRAIDRLRLVRRLGAVPRETLTRALTTLREIFEE
jgi:mRNA interferase MazF